MKVRNQSGFAAIEVILLVLVIVAIGVVALKVSIAKPIAPVASKATPVTSGAPKIQTQNDQDLVASQKAIDNEDLDAPTADESALDAELSTF